MWTEKNDQKKNDHKKTTRKIDQKKWTEEIMKRL